MQTTINTIGETIALVGLALSLLVDGTLVIECLEARPHQIGFDKLIKPISIFLIIILTYKVALWII